MSATRDGGGPNRPSPTVPHGRGCSRCEVPAVRRSGNMFLCPRHYRFQGMRSRARRDGKHVPGTDDLSRLEADLDPPMACPFCERPMNWLAVEGHSTAVSLQHDRVDPANCRLICLGCNVRHASLPGDSFYDLPAGHKWCGRCERVLPVASFVADHSRAGGLKGHCKECSRVEHLEWVRLNSDRVNRQQRERRARSV